MFQSGAAIIPVFYHVSPSDLRWTRSKDGVYGQALHKLGEKTAYDPQTQEEKPRYDSTTIGDWRDALSRVAGISGFDLDGCNGDEGELLDQVVECVLRKVKKTPLNVAKYPVGLDDKVKEFENEVLLPQRHSGKASVVGIVGSGGVGKTTLAKELFNRKSSLYSRSCFLSDVRENANKTSLISLQRKLLESLTGWDEPIDSVDQGIETLKNRLSSFEALIILDDVDQVDQVDALLPDQTVHSDSLVVITSRNKDILTSSGLENLSIYKLAGLNKQHSRELFCSHAFRSPFPLPEFEYVVDMFLKACDGLPLSLKVFGALLCGKNDMSYWEDQLDLLQQILPTEIQERLKLSYNSLNKQEQQIFLDIACFLTGHNRDTAIRIWDGSGWKGRLGFQNLQSKCLVEVDTEINIHMHDHFRDLGREIAQMSSPHRFWRTRENIDALLQQPSNGQVITVRGIRMVPSEYNDNYYFSKNDNYDNDVDDAFSGIVMRRLQLLDIEDALLGESIWKRVQYPDLIWLHCKDCLYSSLPSWIPMKNLRVLQVSGSLFINTLWESELKAPLQLRELEIHAPLSNIPESIGLLKHLERIVVKGFLQKLPEEFGQLQSLNTLVLSGCSEMETLPDSFGNLTTLQHLDLSGCDNLESLPNSFGNLINLKYLNLADCSNLTISSQTLGNIRTLEYIDFYHCGAIEVLPQLVHQRSLVKLDLSYPKLKELPSAIGELSNLEVLILECPLLETLPLSLGDLKNLKELKLEDCQELKCLPASFALLTQLTDLRLWNCPLIPEHELQFPPTLIKLDLSGCNNLRRVDGLCGLAKLQRLEINHCTEVEELCIETLASLKGFEVYGCTSLKSIRGFEALTELRTLSIRLCKDLETLEGIEHLMSLEKIFASGCPKLQWGGVVEHLRSLHKKLVT